jgi:hypothetical protein
MHFKQILKNFNIDRLLFKAVLFYKNRPACDAHEFLRKILPKICLKKWKKPMKKKNMGSQI